MSSSCDKFGAAAILSACLILSPTAALADDAAAPINPMQGLAKGTLKAFAGEPLFSASRSLPSAAQVVLAPRFVQPAAVAEPPPSVHLIGVIEGSNSIAIVRNDADQKTSLLHTGDHVGAWQVTVLSTGLRLAKENRSIDYGLFDKVVRAPDGLPPGLRPGSVPFPPIPHPDF